MINWYDDLPDIKPKYLAITKLIRSLIQEEKLLPGQRLPSERKLADTFKVDRSTVSRALSELSSVGLIIKKGGSGNFISQLPQIHSLPTKVNWNLFLENKKTTYSSYQSEITQARALNNDNLLDGAGNELPMELIPKLGSLQINWHNFLLAQKQSQDAGYLPLIETLGKIHEQKNQFKTDDQTLLITGGAQQSLLLVLRSLLQVGDSVAFAKPSYFNSSALFKTVGVRTFSIPLTPFGIDLDVLEDVILKHRIKLLILNPTFQNPTGEIISLEQRQRILKLCQDYQIAIIEDDVFGWLVDQKDEVPTFKSLAPENVIYISSLSKLLGSSTRIGWIVAPRAIGQRLLQVQKKLDIVPSMLAQVMANLALTDESFDSEIAGLKLELTKRRKNITQILHEYRSEWNFNSPKGGFYLWIKQTDPEIFEKLLKKNILVKPGPIYGTSRKDFRFNFANFDLDKQQQLRATLSKE
ncbi:aminotransferase-like domain-containing protein [Companilactobacillus baiquanensis]|uniref:PLP-dependent aminotransferase family protein n=1 Tax=Companilactobacillus baiquanensis TaxID=2486005 RepID=A0ABW1UZS0_9LACO|nr:PLP-dependent aminotransferase family protein [Companilactobacillus baiquanensis]